jgi:hypothetical protein
MLRNQFNNGRANDNAIGDTRDVGGLLWRTHAKAYGDWQVGVRFEARHSFINASLCRDLQARDASDADII